MSYINEKDKTLCSMSKIEDDRLPDIQLSIETKRLFADVIEACKKRGLDGYEFIYEFLTWDEIAEIAAYNGFPVRYPHYLFGMEYEHMRNSYEYGHSKIYEMVISNDPCYAYLLNSNSLVDNLTVVAHAYAHNDLMKNNFWFANTNRNMINETAVHGTKIRRYCQKYGRDKVISFLNLALSVENLIDPTEAFDAQYTQMKDVKYDDEMSVMEPRKIGVKESHEYMDGFINPDSFIEEERARIKKQFRKRNFKFPENTTRDIIGFVADNSPRLRNWMRDILYMIKEEALYVVPIITTKILNEGWAAYWDRTIMIEDGFAGDDGIVDYADHHSRVLGSKYSVNPYALGSMLLDYAKDRYDKGKVGQEWENCKDDKKRKTWDLKWNKGLEKLFDIRTRYNDYMLIDEFMDQDFCDENKFWSMSRLENGDWVIKSKNVDVIKKEVLAQVGLNSRPILQVKDANCLNLGHLHIEHVWTKRFLNIKDAKETLKFLCRLWGRPVVLTTYDCDDEFTNEDLDVPLEFNDKIMKICLFAYKGPDMTIVESGFWNDYSSKFLSSDKKEKME